jgi:hypothetical protein
MKKPVRRLVTINSSFLHFGNGADLNYQEKVKGSKGKSESLGGFTLDSSGKPMS